MWRYGVGHSQLLLRSPGDAAHKTINVLFEAVVFMKLGQSYPAMTLRLATDGEYPDFEGLDLLPIRLLRLVLSSPAGAGLVACSRVVVSQVDDPDDDSWGPGSVLLSATA